MRTTYPKVTFFPSGYLQTMVVMVQRSYCDFNYRNQLQNANNSLAKDAQKKDI